MTLWNLSPQQLHGDFAPDPIISDAGLLAVRAVKRPLGIRTALAARLPAPPG